MKPLKRAVINSVLFIIVYVGVTFVLNHYVDIEQFVIISIIYFVLNYIVYSILEKVSKD